MMTNRLITTSIVSSIVESDPFPLHDTPLDFGSNEPLLTYLQSPPGTVNTHVLLPRVVWSPFRSGDSLFDSKVKVEVGRLKF